MRQDTRPGLTTLGKLVVFLFVAGCCLAGYYLLMRGSGSSGGSPPAASGTEAAGSEAEAPRGTVEIGIAYGTEKERWLKWAVERFAETKAGRRIRVNLIPRGSLEGAQDLLAGDQRIHVWSPASALYTDLFVQDWMVKYGKEPILKQEVLALSPMVFVFWKERYEAFHQRYPEVSFRTMSQALAEPGGWQTLAGKPEWGLFKLGHTHPNQSNSGLMSLVLMAYEYHGKSRNLGLEDILDTGFQSWFQKLEGGVSGLVHSTGSMMREMVLKGPSAYDALFVYESVAIDYLKNAEGRWGQLQVVYPQRNMWNDNPYYIIDAPWSTRQHHEAAETLLEFLLSEEIQRQALVHGFRPGNPAVPMRFPESPFVQYQSYGLSIDLPTTCEAPRAEVVQNLLASWQRNQGSR